MSNSKNKREKKKIVFFGSEINFTVGGGYFFIFNLAKSISQNEDYNVYCVNYPNKKLEEIYKDDAIHFLDVRSCNFKLFEGADFVLPLNYLFFFLNRTKDIKHSRVILYNWHPDTNEMLNNQILYWYNDYEGLLSFLGSKNSVYFMDKSCKLSMNDWGSFNFDDNYIPIFPSSSHQEYEALEINNKGRISIGWLGRLDPDKINTVINLLDNLMLSDTDLPVYLHIIGDGSVKRKIDERKYSSKINIIFTSYLFGEERDRYIRENIDIMVALGMASLDVVNLSVPTVIPIMSPQYFSNNQYVFIFDTDGYSLGWSPDVLTQLNVKTYTIEEVIQIVYAPDGKSSLGLKCYNFLNENFDLTKSMQDIIDALNQTQLSIADCLPQPVVNRQLKAYDKYKKLTKGSYNAFRSFTNRLNKMKGKSIFGKAFVIIKMIARLFWMKIKSRSPMHKIIKLVKSCAVMLIFGVSLLLVNKHNLMDIAGLALVWISIAGFAFAGFLGLVNGCLKIEQLKK